MYDINSILLLIFYQEAGVIETDFSRAMRLNSLDLELAMSLGNVP